MHPANPPLAPLDPHKTRAFTSLSSIYAPRKPKPRKNKTAQSRMLEELPLKPNLSPFNPLPAIGQKLSPETKVFVLNLNKNERPSTMERTKLKEILKPLTPLRINTYRKDLSFDTYRKDSFDNEDKKPQQLLRENTYNVLEPVYINAAKIKNKQESPVLREALEPIEISNENDEKQPKISPKTRFKQVAKKVTKLQSMPETGKLLCLRERETFHFKPVEDEKVCKLQSLPQSPTQKLTKLSEIFQDLDMHGRHRDKMKKENSWF